VNASSRPLITASLTTDKGAVTSKVVWQIGACESLNFPLLLLRPKWPVLFRGTAALELSYDFHVTSLVTATCLTFYVESDQSDICRFTAI